MKKRIFVIVAVLTVLFVLWNLKTQNDSSVRFEVESHNVEINGLKVHYATAGNPQNPPLVLLHGIGSSFERFNRRVPRFMGVLSKEFYVYAPEHPGFFRSQVPPTTWTMSNYNEYVEAFINQLEIKNPVIVGQSFGGKLAAYYTSQHPDKVKLLVLGAPSITFKDIPIYEKLYRFLGPLASRVTKTKYIPIVIKRFIVENTLGIPKELVELDITRYAIMADFVNKTAIVDNSDVVPLINTKTILIWGKLDYIVYFKQTRIVSKLFPNVELHELDGGHTVMMDRAETTLKFIMENLGKPQGD